MRDVQDPSSIASANTQTRVALLLLQSLLPPPSPLLPLVPSIVLQNMSDRQAPAYVVPSYTLHTHSLSLTHSLCHPPTNRSRRNAYKNKGIFGQDGQSCIYILPLPPPPYTPTPPPLPRLSRLDSPAPSKVPSLTLSQPHSQTELRRRREEAQVEIRKQKREESVAKRRNFNAPSSGADSDEEGGPDSSVRLGLASSLPSSPVLY